MKINDFLKILTSVIFILGAVFGLTGCGAQTTTGAQEVALETPVEAEDNVQEASVETEANDPEAALIVNKGFLIASDYNRTLTVDGQSRNIRGSYKAGETFYAKSLRAELTPFGHIIGDDHVDCTAYSMDLDPIDVLNAEDFTGLKAEGDTITGTILSEELGSGKECVITIDPETKAVKELSADNVSLVTDLSSFPEDWLSDNDTFTYWSGNEAMLVTTMEPGVDFASIDALELGKHYKAVSDGDLTFHLTYDIYMNGYDESLGGGITAPAEVDLDSLTLDDIYISPQIRYGDIKGHTLGDLSLEMKALCEYQLSQNDSQDNHYRASDHYFIGRGNTNDLPEWYYEVTHKEH